MPLPRGHTLDVPGVCRYYEVQGSGPAVMLVGHPMGASGFAVIARLLAEDYTVVTYDPRGFARSTIDDRDQDAEPDLLADDVRRVLEAVGDGPADVFGSSGGAVTGLAVGRPLPRPRTSLVAHEPPLVLLLPDADEARAAMHDIYDTYRDSGIGAAWQRFSTFTGMGLRPQGAEAAARRRRPRRWRPANASSVTACCQSRSTSRTSLPCRSRRPESWPPGGLPPRASSLGAQLSRSPNASVRRWSTSPAATPVSPATLTASPMSSTAPWHSS